MQERTAPDAGPPSEASIERIVNLGRTDSGGVCKLPSKQSTTGQGRAILDENAFEMMVAFERKRSERSRKAYALILVAAGDCLPTLRRENLLEKIATTLAAQTRDTDVTGWHRSGCIVGVIFTDVVASERNVVIPTLLARVTDRLHEIL